MAILTSKAQGTNVGEMERWASLIGGSSLIAYGLVRRDLRGAALAALGSGFLLRGSTGHCQMYQALGVNTAEEGFAKGTGRHVTIPYELGIRVDRAITINKAPEELFNFWRNLENLPAFMDHLDSVRILDDRRSHWIAKAPAGTTVEWDAEIINEIPNEVIGWRSLEGADVDNAGSVRFAPSAEGRGTEVKISLQYNPPAGSLGAAVARLFGEDPGRQIRDDLRRFKELMEKGNITTKSSNKQRANFSADPTTGKTGKVWDRDAVTQSSEESFPASDPPSWTPETL
ncbi:MAG TPA: SRPBCC family protein [Bryobacteraceae bacterium]|nr:SRPBCC family protein [Bryobacteraceae bacterium]